MAISLFITDSTVDAVKSVHVNEFNQSSFREKSWKGLKLAEGAVSSLLEIGAEVWGGTSDSIVVLDGKVLLLKLFPFSNYYRQCK